MLKELLQHNVEWSKRRQLEDPDYFGRLAASQRPKFLWIGCSDSRVPANVITGLEPGEVFVHRNIANLVHRGDINLLSVLEYAVGSLEINHIIVCGHYGCGGIEAAVDGNQHGIIDHWLQPIRDTADENADELSSFPGRKDRLDRLCELSVSEQINSLSRTPVIRSAWSRGRELHIHGWIYGLKDGLIRNLRCSQSRKTFNPRLFEQED